MKTTIAIAACSLFMVSAAGCKKEGKKSGLDSNPPAAGSVSEGTTDTPGTPATDPTTPSMQTAAPAPGATAPSPGTTAAPSPGTTTAPSPGTTSAPSPGTTAPAPTAPAGTMRGSTGATGATGATMHDAGAGRVPPPTP